MAYFKQYYVQKVEIQQLQSFMTMLCLRERVEYTYGAKEDRQPNGVYSDRRENLTYNECGIHRLGPQIYNRIHTEWQMVRLKVLRPPPPLLLYRKPKVR